MRKAYFIICLTFVYSSLLNAQVGINTSGSSPDQSSILDVSGTKGILIPRMTLVQRNAISSPANGLLIYQTDNNPGFYFYNTNAIPNDWQRVGEVAPGQNGFQPFLNPSTNFNVPANVTRIYFEACSAGGGHGGNYLAGGTTSNFGGGGGGGGFIRGYLNVTPGQVLTINVGTAGTNGTNGSGGTAATNGNDGGSTSVYDGGNQIFLISGGSGGFAASGSAGNGGFPGNYVTSNATICKILGSHVGLTGMTGISGLGAGAISNDLSGVGGTVGTSGVFNFFGQFLQYVVLNPSTGVVTQLYYNAPYFGKGGGRGDVSTPGYVYFYW